MDDYDDSVMVALLPTTTYWSHLELPHLTLVYVGKVAELRPTVWSDLLKVAYSIATVNPPQNLYTLGTAVFGTDEKVDVILIEPAPDLLRMRALFEQYNGSEFKEFRPHATIGPTGSANVIIPEKILFDRIVVCWGTEKRVFVLGSGLAP